MPRNQRRRFFVDRNVQGALIRRAVVYLLLVVVSLALLSAVWITLTEGPISGLQLLQLVWARFGPAFLAAFLLIPILVSDCIRLSNRFVGPMIRVRRAMKDASEGGPIAPLKFRKGDFWYEFADDFNRFMATQTAERQSDSQRITDTEDCYS